MLLRLKDHMNFLLVSVVWPLISIGYFLFSHLKFLIYPCLFNMSWLEYLPNYFALPSRALLEQGTGQRFILESMEHGRIELMGKAADFMEILR